ncbi:MAG: winged helix-turn-helix transcriptional regulator [Bdellovibrionaceae bacterium]|nr:winged helix-turn-helix transcriptional regulator [Pseudobdellovibrionaceae bacterium]
MSVEKMSKACKQVCLTLKALSHPQRLMILGHLLNGEKNVIELLELCDISQPQMSQFLARMKAEGLIVSRREGKFQYYEVADSRLQRLMRTLQEEFCR